MRDIGTRALQTSLEYWQEEKKPQDVLNQIQKVDGSYVAAGSLADDPKDMKRGAS